MQFFSVMDLLCFTKLCWQSEYLKKINFGLKVINMPWLNKVDSGWLLNTIKDYNKVFVLEDHSVYGGLGDKILNVLAEQKALEGKDFKILGLDEYPECGTPWEVLEYHKLDGKSLALRISGSKDIEVKLEEEKAKQKYTAEAPQ